MSSVRTPLGRVRGLGSAKEGVQHWWAQRLTALALVPLSLWFIYAMVKLTGADRDVVAAWFAHPLNAVLSIVLIATAFHHAQLGLQVVIEDYVHHEGRKLASIIGVKFLAVLLAAGAIFGVLKLAFGVHG
ncbi:MAG TPA: succinate dehydrogenase, hydrophobic membrane anchor protein [Alphaproteobacteria bacterium]|nr:succinate dehydrogenase, hydrophobic membrane anchor protein [Alphaproteobacteria bacterium]